MYKLHQQSHPVNCESDETAFHLHSNHLDSCTYDQMNMQSATSFAASPVWPSSLSSSPSTSASSSPWSSLSPSSLESSCSSSSPVPLNTSSSTRSVYSCSSRSASTFSSNTSISASCISGVSALASLPSASFNQKPVKNNCYFNSPDCSMNESEVDMKSNKVLAARPQEHESASPMKMLPWLTLESSPVTAKVNTMVTTVASTMIIPANANATTAVVRGAARMAGSSPKVTVFPSFHGRQSNESLMYKEDLQHQQQENRHHFALSEEGQDDDDDEDEEVGKLVQWLTLMSIFDKNLTQKVTSATSSSPSTSPASSSPTSSVARSNGELILKNIKCSRGKSTRKSNLLLVLMLLMAAISSFTQGILAIRITHLSVPELIYKGEPYWLNCSYDLDSEPLYSIKWFKKLHEKEHRAEDGLIWSEFYRFIPNDDEIKKCFNMKGVKVDIEKSNLGNVYIQSGDFDSEGTYKCEVSADAPSFETVREVRDARIYYFAENQPTVKGTKGEYGIGEYVNASCSITFTKLQFKSMTRLTWFINGESVPHAYIRSANNRNHYQSNSYGFTKAAKNADDDSSDENSFLESYPPPYPLFTGSNVNYNNNNNNNNNGNSDEEDLNVNLNIKFLVNPKHFINGIMRLRCTASSIPELYSRSTEEVILLQSSRGPSSRFSSSSNSLSKYKFTKSHLATVTLLTCHTLLILLVCSLADLPFTKFT